MSCSVIQKELSAYRDGDLSGVLLQSVSAHLEGCGACAKQLRQMNDACSALRALPRPVPSEALVSRVLDRLEIETRGPGLALLYRSAWAARPLMVPSLLPAALVLICTLSLVLAAGARDIRSRTAQHAPGKSRFGVSGSVTNPFSPGGDVLAPHGAGDIFLDEQLIGMAEEQTIFVETIVTRDGRVSQVKLLEGDSRTAAPILDELRLQRHAPGRDLDGQPVAMRAFRLISAMEVRAPLT